MSNIFNLISSRFLRPMARFSHSSDVGALLQDQSDKEGQEEAAAVEAKDDVEQNEESREGRKEEDVD